MVVCTNLTFFFGKLRNTPVQGRKCWSDFSLLERGTERERGGGERGRERKARKK